MAHLSLTSVDELIGVRQAQHGGGRGAPLLNADGTREGQALNRAVIVMTSASLQTYCEDVFFEVSQIKLGLSDPQMESYRSLYSQWGNPSPENIRKQFRRLGIIDVIDGLSWRKCDNAAVVRKLGHLNQLRNQVAHGRPQLQVAGQRYSLTLAKAQSHRNFTEQFGGRFEARVRGILGLPPL